MLQSEIIHIDSIGDVLIRHSNKAKHLNITIKPFKGVIVSVPNRLSFSYAINFIKEKELWIIKHIEKIKYLENRIRIFDEKSGFVTKKHKLELKKENVKNILVKVSSESIVVIYNHKLLTNSLEVQSAIKKGIELALKTEAKSFLPQRVRLLSDKHNFNFNKLTIKNIKSRWGSCSAKNNINLSIYLMQLPAHLIDYVILHELAHTIHHNHSAMFWNLLQSVSNEAKDLDNELKKYKTNVY